VITNNAERLDADELLHLALRAAGQNQHEEAITFLKRALDIAPDDGRLHYMLGAEHAQIGMYDRASEEMATAVELDPALTTARFQLGLLHLTAARVDQATQTWAPLDELDPDHFLRLFKTGLEHLAKDRFQECADYLKRGIAANDANLSLNQDMQRILQTAEEHAGKESVPGSPPEAAAAPRLLSAYRRNRTDDKD
jgi:tetratricopeptide (TPR) repeat protein